MHTDLHLLPLYRQDGEDRAGTLPGLHLLSPPRRAARSRQNDQLILHLTFTGTAALPQPSQDQLIQRLAETYYRTSGAVTTALRTLVESLNATLLEQNLRSESKGLQAAGLFMAVVFRNDQLLLAQSGPTYIFAITRSAYRRFYNPQLAGHGLGLGRAGSVLIHHLPAEPGALLILSPAPPPAWDTPALQTAYGRPLRLVQRGLLKPAGENLNALLVQVRAGEGKVHLHAAPPDETPPRPPQTKTAAPSPSAPPVAKPAPAAAAADPVGPASASSSPPQAPRRLPRAASWRTLWAQLSPGLLAVARALREALRQVTYTLRAFLTRLLPDNELFTLPGSTMAFIAVAVPVVLVIAAFFVYQQRGRRAQFDTYMQYAEAAQINAQGKTNPDDQRAAWSAVLYYVDQAEQIQVTEQTRALRLEAQGVLDQMDGVTRLTYAPILPAPLAENVVIHRIAATAENVYLLNQNGGNVVRAWRSGQGFETDVAFRCGPLPNEALIVGPLIDVAALPPANYLNAHLLGMDANGILVYCRHGEPPIAISLPPPDSHWGNPLAFTLDEDVLYVLDPQTNAVWVYAGENYEFTERPRLFFDADVPPMADVIDLAVDGGELYLLHADGHLTQCSFGFNVQPTRCTDPAPFTDARPGRETSPFLTGASLTQIAFTPPPDPSIYLLDPAQQAVYHLSLRLALQRQYRPQVVEGPPRDLPVTAFALGPDRALYLAFGNQVWAASLP